MIVTSQEEQKPAYSPANEIFQSNGHILFFSVLTVNLGSLEFWKKDGMKIQSTTIAVFHPSCKAMDIAASTQVSCL